MSPLKLVASNLDRFVELVDREGGASYLNTSADWVGVNYTPTLKIDQRLDPFSEAYCNAQIRLYKEISGRELDQERNELLSIDLERHVAQRNAFGMGDPSTLAMHYSRLSKLIVNGKLPPNAKVLDMGAGWGLSSEFFATLGCNVRAVDINQQFVELINLRSQRYGYGIEAVRGGFEEVSLPETYDFVVFYECLHHAVRPWTVISRIASELAPDGAIGLAGEPIQSSWWSTWGIRLDPVSIYCIRKYGWFESGWSKAFIIDCLNRANLIVDYIDDPDPRVGPIVIARNDLRLQAKLGSTELAERCADDRWMHNGEYLVSSGDACLQLNYPASVNSIRFNIQNFRGKSIALRITEENGQSLFQGNLNPGENTISVKFSGYARLRFVSDTWVPHEEFGTVDMRRMSFHLVSVEYFRQ